MVDRDRLRLDGTAFEGRREEFYWLWILATTTYGVGDVVTTVALLRFDARVGEANALLRAAVEAFGLAGLVGLKLGVFLACLGVQVYAVADSEDPVVVYAPPALLAVVGGFTTAFNLRLLVG
ncbi:MULTISPECIES: hypothetical protein [Halorussus]|uniref:hypothetical protein n=1 Tax=Halorussus TaxID=1070314 RepID=UPI00209F2C2B|nr:hypothetical protein [Halorussus vallis]USZ75322.1 hypothetical protein NGM07_18050 [Halorussus vallis]